MERKGNHLKVHRRGLRKASTFKAFCEKHDCSTFAPLETEPFTGTKEQIFLIGYRAICWELYRKIFAIRSNPTIRDLLDCGQSISDQRKIQAIIKAIGDGFAMGYQDALRTKTAMDTAYIKKDYSSYSTYRVKLIGPLSIASTGSITPNRTFNGEELQVLHDPSADIEWLSFGVDVNAEEVNIIYIWETNALAPSRYIEPKRAQ